MSSSNTSQAMRSRGTELYGSIKNSIGQMERLDLTLLLTLLLLILYPPRYATISLPLSVVAIAAIVLPTLRQNRYLWLFAAVLVGASSIANWHSTDNHKYLLCYWCLAIFFSRYSANPEQSLANTSRWLLVAVFSVALVQKNISSDYLSGSFFYYELLFDKRFAGMAQHVGGIREFISTLNFSARAALVNFDSTLDGVKLSSNAHLVYLAGFLTWWNFLIQLFIAVTFAIPVKFRLAQWRHPLLLLFLFSTYLFAPVIGFGWLLIILGIMQLEPTAVRTRMTYLLAFILLQVYKFPWSSLFVDK